MTNDKRENVIKTLNNILEKNYDAQQGYSSAFSATNNLGLKSFFDKQIKQRISFGNKTKEKIVGLGGSPQMDGSLSGDLHRAWMNLKSAISSNNEEAILASCQTGEMAMVEDCNAFLELDNIPHDLHDCVLQQRNAILESVREIQQFENVLA